MTPPWGNITNNFACYYLYNFHFLCCPFRALCYICSYLPKALPLRDVAIGLVYSGLSAQRCAKVYWCKNSINDSDLENHIIYLVIFCMRSSGWRPIISQPNGKVLKGRRLGIIINQQPAPWKGNIDNFRKLFCIYFNQVTTHTISNFYVAPSGRRVIYVLIYPRRCPFGTLPLG